MGGGFPGGMGGMPDMNGMDPKQLEQMAKQMGAGGMPKLPGLGGPKLPGLGGGSPFGGKKK